MEGIVWKVSGDIGFQLGDKGTCALEMITCYTIGVSRFLSVSEAGGLNYKGVFS